MLTQATLTELIKYDPITGVFVWRSRDVKWFESSAYRTSEHVCNLWNSRYANTVAGGVNKTTNSYRIKILSRFYEAGTIAYMYMTGEIPEEVGHKNKNSLDVRFENLIASSVIDNRRNRPKKANNKSGIIGVCYHKQQKVWAAKIRNNGSDLRLGYYKSFFDACCARKSKEIELGYMNHFTT